MQNTGWNDSPVICYRWPGARMGNPDQAFSLFVGWRHVKVVALVYFATILFGAYILATLVLNFSIKAI